MKPFYIDFEDFKNDQLCSAWVAVAIVGAAAVGGAATIYSANKASEAQTNAANKAADTSMGMYKLTREDLAPYRELGNKYAGKLDEQMDFLTSPIKMDQAALEQTPGYQFTKTQGLKAVQNSAAARGLGVSGAALKGAATFATGLADQTYKTQFDIENINRSNAYNRLKGVIDAGQGAAAGTGAAGTSAANTAAGAAIGAGNAQAAAWNAAGGAIGKAAGDVGGYAAYKGLYGNSNPIDFTSPASGSPAGLPVQA